MSFLLHHTRVGREHTEHVAFVLHGVLGSGSNFRSLAKALADRCPDWSFILVDLRLHGRSGGAPAPHTLEACASDLAYLAQQLGVQPRAVIGHSFGGKVALAYAETRPPGLEQVWVLDAHPGAHAPDTDHEVRRVLRVLQAVSSTSASRKDFVDALVHGGLSLGTSEWLAQNLERDSDGYRLRLDLGAIEELLEDYFRRDLWHVLEEPPGAQHVHLVVAERSTRLDAAARNKLQGLNRADRVHLHSVPRAGHWLHVDNPEGLLAVLVPWFSAPRS